MTTGQTTEQPETRVSDPTDCSLALSAIAYAQTRGIYAVPMRHATGIYWRPRMPNGYDPDLGWLLDNQPTHSGWKSWPDAVNALGKHLESTGAQ